MVRVLDVRNQLDTKTLAIMVFDEADASGEDPN